MTAEAAPAPATALEGNDSSNGAPYNGTYGDYNTAGTDADGKPIYFGGDKGSQGKVYYFGVKEIGNTEEDITNESKVIESNDGKQGSRGNDGWGGMNLQRIYYDHSNQVKRHAEFHGGTYYGHSSSTTQTRQIGFIVYNFDSAVVAYGRDVAIGPLGGEYGAANNSKVKDYTNALFFYTDDSTSWEDKTYKNVSLSCYNPIHRPDGRLYRL